MRFLYPSTLLILSIIKHTSGCLVTGAPILKAISGTEDIRPLFIGSGILARDEPPEDFGTEKVTVTINGTTFSYTRHIGVKIEGREGEDEVIHVSSRLLKVITDIVDDKTICSSVFRPLGNSTLPTSKLSTSSFNSSTPSKLNSSSLNNHQRSFMNESSISTVSNVKPRVPGGDAVLEEIVRGPCTDPRLEYILNNLDSTGSLVDMIPAVGNADVIREFDNPEVAQLYEMLNAMGDLEPQIIVFTVRRRRTGTMALLNILNAVERGIQIGLTLRVLAQNFHGEPTTRDCKEEEEAPACPDPDCAGEKGKCTTKVNMGCTCYPLIILPPNQPTWDKPSFDLQQHIFHISNPSAPEDGKVTCNGIGSIPFITNEAGKKAIKEFCGTGPISGSKDKQPPPKDINKDTPNAVRFSVEFDATFSISSDECNDFFTHILSDCDGNNPLNPYNLKHGGKVKHPKGATLIISPSNGSNPRCNSYQSKRWVDRGLGHDKILQYCKETSLRGRKGDRFLSVYNKGKNTEVRIAAEWTKDSPMSLEDCEAGFNRVLDGCDGLDSINNPLNNKYGGSFTTDKGVIMMIAPSVIPPTFPPDAIDPNGNEIVPQCSDGYFTGENDLERALEDYCKDGHDFYKSTFCYKTGWGGCSGLITLSSSAIDQDETYKQGAPVCRKTLDWNPGKIRAQDCKDALHAMRKKCDRSVSFVYNCVKWEYFNTVYAEIKGPHLKPSEPKCGVYDYTATLMDLNNIIRDLHDRSDQRCCKKPNGASDNIASSGKTGVNLWSDSKSEICMPCSTLSEYVTNVGLKCQRVINDTMTLVGGTQDIFGYPGLRLEI